jgi:putative SOS response-associated peptidase YedK
MCNRISQQYDTGQLALRLEWVTPRFQARPSYNIPPTSTLAVVSGGDEPVLTGMRWGLLPRWKQLKGDTHGFTNAQAEGVAEKVSFRDAVRKRRCLVPATGYFEWVEDGGKRPIHIKPRHHDLVTFAGLWEPLTTPLATPDLTATCAIITTQAQGALASIHDRMPVILRPADAQAWLDPALPLADALALLRPFPDEDLVFYPVTRRVNRASFDDPECIQADSDC